jgi:hypothetical protein
MARAQIALIIPLGDAPGYIPGHPDQGLPGGGYYPDQGLPGSPVYPDQGLPGRPPHVGNRPPGSWDRPEYPSTGPVRPGRPVDPSWGIDADLGPAHPWVPPSGEELPPPPEEIAHQVVVAVWRPEQGTWTVAVAQGPHPAPHG